MMRINLDAATAGMERSGGASDRADEDKRLKEACQQFEGILLGTMWKRMMASARAVGGKKDDRPFRIMEDLSVEMSAQSLAGSDEHGLWRVLYDQLALTGSSAKRSEDEG